MPLNSSPMMPRLSGVHRTILSVAVWLGSTGSAVVSAETLYEAREQSRIEAGEKFAQPAPSVRAGSVRHNWTLSSRLVEGAAQGSASANLADSASAGAAKTTKATAKSTRTPASQVDVASTEPGATPSLTAAQRMFGARVEAAGAAASQSAMPVVAQSQALADPAALSAHGAQASPALPGPAEVINRFVVGDTGPVVVTAPSEPVPVLPAEPRNQRDRTIIAKTAEDSGVKRALSRSSTRTTTITPERTKDIKPKAPETVIVTVADSVVAAPVSRSEAMFSRDVTGIRSATTSPLSDAEVPAVIKTEAVDIDVLQGLERRRPETPVLRSAPGSS